MTKTKINIETELTQLCTIMLEQLQTMYSSGKISKKNYEKHAKLKRRFLALKDGGSL